MSLGRPNLSLSDLILGQSNKSWYVPDRRVNFLEKISGQQQAVHMSFKDPLVRNSIQSPS